MRDNTLIARDGYIYTDGEVYGSIIYLANGTSPDSFYEIAVEEYQKILDEQRATILATVDM